MKSDTITAAELHEAALGLAETPVPTFADPEVKAALAEQAVAGRAFSMAGYMRLAAADLRAMERLEQTVARLCALFEPAVASVVAKLRQYVHEYAVYLSTSGPSYEDALQQIEDAFSSVWAGDIDKLRERFEQLALTVPRPRELLRVDFETLGEKLRTLNTPPSELAHDRRAEWLRKAKPSQLGRGHKNKYAARPPGKR